MKKNKNLENGELFGFGNFHFYYLFYYFILLFYFSGENTHGQLGIPSLTKHSKPTFILKEEMIKEIYCGAYFTLLRYGFILFFISNFYFLFLIFNF